MWPPKSPRLTAKMVKASLVLFPAQNISVYTISLGNVSDSLDATMASKRCRKEVCEFGWSVARWLLYWFTEQIFKMTKFVTPVNDAIESASQSKES